MATTLSFGRRVTGAMVTRVGTTKNADVLSWSSVDGHYVQLLGGATRPSATKILARTGIFCCCTFCTNGYVTNIFLLLFDGDHDCSLNGAHRTEINVYIKEKYYKSDTLS